MKVSSHSSSNKILLFYVMSLFPSIGAIVLCSGHLQLMPNTQEGFVSDANIVSRAPAKLYNKQPELSDTLFTKVLNYSHKNGTIKKSSVKLQYLGHHSSAVSTVCLQLQKYIHSLDRENFTAKIINTIFFVVDEMPQL